jgi:hypothetical protein
MIEWVDAMRCDVDEGDAMLMKAMSCWWRRWAVATCWWVPKWTSAEEVEMPSDERIEVSVDHVVVAGKGGRVLVSDISKDWVDLIVICVVEDMQIGDLADVSSSNNARKWKLLDRGSRIADTPMSESLTPMSSNKHTMWVIELVVVWHEAQGRNVQVKEERLYMNEVEYSMHEWSWVEEAGVRQAGWDGDSI